MSVAAFIIPRAQLSSMGKGSYQPVAKVGENVVFEATKDSEAISGKVTRKEDRLENGRAVEYVMIVDLEERVFVVRTNDLTDTPNVRFFPDT